MTAWQSHGDSPPLPQSKFLRRRPQTGTFHLLFLHLVLGSTSEAPFAHLLFLTQNVVIFSHRAVIHHPHATLYNSSEHKSRLILVSSALLLFWPSFFSIPLRFVFCAFCPWLSSSNVVATPTLAPHAEAVLALNRQLAYPLLLSWPFVFSFFSWRSFRVFVRASWLKSPPQMCTY